MRWEDERYVRVYTRDTVTWKMLSWQGRAVLLELFRKVDRAGILDAGDYGIDGIAALISMPIDVVGDGIADLITKRCIRWTAARAVFIPNFLEAQEATSSDAQRKRDQRERAVARAHLSEISNDVSQNGTRSHKPSQVVTSGHSDPCLSEPNLTDPSQSISSASPDFDFESVYAGYPRKEGRKKGLQRCRSQITSRLKYDALLRAVKNYAAHVAGRETQYIKKFDSFMSIWEDYEDAGKLTPNRSQGRVTGRPEPAPHNAESEDWTDRV